MESRQIEILLEKYFEGETSIQEERELKAYFSSTEVAPHLESYTPMFTNFQKQKELQFTKALPLQPRKQNHVKWIGVAASLVALFGTLLYFNNNVTTNQDLGTFSNPEEAFIETQKALNMVSTEVNKGVKSIEVLNEYEQTKKTIFK
ncbi:hypothetical protein [Flavobacterium okayamense]|uniref:Anti-sigma factor n=1 Tax=Flavobacterium okayamense TaxID=2830782 RepID=A0ABN6I2I7_9FLAO|nr:hypothetical protein [Flavobacterium okayamense]BCY29627.1 hypothetical protein KK2020170_24950 [Flavobacterium okayamense]